MQPIFDIKDETEFGRLGILKTAHGEIQTPAFVFCATKGALKACFPDVAKKEGTQIILSNTYHLLVHPGPKLINDLGGLQKITGWNGPMMTDSGGYQIFSLGGYGSVSSEIKGIRTGLKKLVHVTEEGAFFKSYKDGANIFLSPEDSIQAQIDLGADLIFVLDECTAYHIDKKETQKSMERSHRWETRSFEYFEKFKKSHQGLYSIVQGGVYEDLRNESINFVNNLDTFGIGIGGSLGKNLNDMNNVLKIVCPKLTKEKPKHLLGIGTINSILMGIEYNIDTFDCVYPTRLARHGSALVFPETSNNSYINLKNVAYKRDENPLDKNCKCGICATYSRAYLHMMLKAKENIAIMALTQHNIAFMNNFMEQIRNALQSRNWLNFKKEWKRKENL